MNFQNRDAATPAQTSQGKRVLRERCVQWGPGRRKEGQHHTRTAWAAAAGLDAGMGRVPPDPQGADAGGREAGGHAALETAVSSSTGLGRWAELTHEAP